MTAPTRDYRLLREVDLAEAETLVAAGRLLLVEDAEPVVARNAEHATDRAKRRLEEEAHHPPGVRLCPAKMWRTVPLTSRRIVEVA